MVDSKIYTSKFSGGERGIRTLGSAFGRTHDFQSCTIGQLGHLSAIPPTAGYPEPLTFNY